MYWGLEVESWVVMKSWDWKGFSSYAKKGAGSLSLEWGETEVTLRIQVVSLGPVPSWTDVMLQIAKPKASRTYQFQHCRCFLKCGKPNERGTTWEYIEHTQCRGVWIEKQELVTACFLLTPTSWETSIKTHLSLNAFEVNFLFPFCYYLKMSIFYWDSDLIGLNLVDAYL